MLKPIKFNAPQFDLKGNLRMPKHPEQNMINSFF